MEHQKLQIITEIAETSKEVEQNLNLNTNCYVNTMSDYLVFLEHRLVMLHGPFSNLYESHTFNGETCTNM